MFKAPKYQWLLTIALLAACIGIAKQYEVDVTTIYAVASIKDVAESYVQQGNHAGRFFYGPFSLSLIRPLGVFSFVQTKWIWIALQTLCFFTLFHFLYRLYPEIKKSFLFWILTFIFLINPIHNNFQSNNIQLMLMAVMVFAEGLSEGNRRQQFFSGFLLSLIASIKIFPAFICLFYFLSKRKSVVLGLLAGGIFALVSPFLFFGVDTTFRLYRDFVTNVSSYQADNELTRHDILSLASTITTWTEGKVFYGKEWLSTFLFVTFSSSYFLVVWLARKSKSVQRDLWAIGLLLMGVLTPSARVHFWVFAIPAFCQALQNLGVEKVFRSTKGGLLLLSLFLIAFTTQAIWGKNLNDHLEYLRVPIVGLFLLCTVLAAQTVEKLQFQTLISEENSPFPVS